MMKNIIKVLLLIAISIVCVKVFTQSVFVGIFLVCCFIVLFALFVEEGSPHDGKNETCS